MTTDPTVSNLLNDFATFSRNDSPELLMQLRQIEIWKGMRDDVEKVEDYLASEEGLETSIQAAQWIHDHGISSPVRNLTRRHVKDNLPHLARVRPLDGYEAARWLHVAAIVDDDPASKKVCFDHILSSLSALEKNAPLRAAEAYTYLLDNVSGASRRSVILEDFSAFIAKRGFDAPEELLSFCVAREQACRHRKADPKQADVFANVALDLLGVVDNQTVASHIDWLFGQIYLETTPSRLSNLASCLLDKLPDLAARKKPAQTVDIALRLFDISPPENRGVVLNFCRDVLEGAQDPALICSLLDRPQAQQSAVNDMLTGTLAKFLTPPESVPGGEEGGCRMAWNQLAANTLRAVIHHREPALTKKLLPLHPEERSNFVRATIRRSLEPPACRP